VDKDNTTIVQRCLDERTGDLEGQSRGVSSRVVGKPEVVIK
jgi:hypothetical protein